jgi:hypothetical protein
VGSLIAIAPHKIHEIINDGDEDLILTCFGIQLSGALSLPANAPDRHSHPINYANYDHTEKSSNQIPPPV